MIPKDPRHALCEMLIRHAASHAERREAAVRIMEFVSTTPNCFCRTCRQGHITGSAWLLNPAGDKVLLTLHRNLKRWMQLGGHADGDPDVLRVALREATEESGIPGIRPLSAEIMDVDIHPIPARPDRGEPAHFHYDIRFLMQAPHERFAISDESDDLAWWSYADIQSRRAELDEAVLRLARIWQTTAPHAARELPKL